MSQLVLLLQDEAVLLNPGSRVTRSGTTVQDWDSPVDEGLFPVAVQGLTTTEELGERDGARARYRVYLEPGAPISHVSRLRWGSKTLDVVGVPRVVYQLLTAEPHHLEVDAKEVLG